MRKHLTTIAVILAAATGCDNVEWGDAYIQIIEPPTSDSVVVEEPVAEPEVDPEAGNLRNPLLLAGIVQNGRAALTLVGEVHGPELRPFPDPSFPSDEERLGQELAVGRRWTLFSEGVRVGTLVSDALGTAARVCRSRPEVSGPVELIPAASGATRVMAIAEDDVARPYEEYRPVDHIYDQRVATLTMAQRVIPAEGATWPVSVLDSRQHIQAFDVPGDEGPYIAATFMYRDDLSIRAPGPGAYSIFVLGEDVAGTQREVYASYRSVSADGKGAPRYFDHLDWDADGDEDILLDVLGAEQRWFAGLTRENGEWVTSFQDDCGGPPIAPGR